MAPVRTFVDAILEFHYDLFDALFTRRIVQALPDRRKRDRIAERARTAALAAADSLIRYCERRRMTLPAVEQMLTRLEPLASHIDSEQLANPNITAEAQAEEVLASCPCPETLNDNSFASDYRLAVYSLVRALKRVAPVFAAWERLGYPRSFDQLDRTIAEIDEITDRIGTLAPSANFDDDERFEIDYREYILQRFYQVEAGTVRMTAGTFIDLRQLFVLPDTKPLRTSSDSSTETTESGAFLSLAEARARFSRASTSEGLNQVPALQVFATHSRLVIIGAPGAGKSTFLEWLNLQLASAEFMLVQGDQQAIPLLLRVRQLDPKALPEDAGLIAAATEGEDRAQQMPTGWLDRQMQAGRVVLMLDGLDETEPELLEGKLLPWFVDLCRRYPTCRYLVSSRPVGYPSAFFQKLEFAEHEICDFSKEQVSDYAGNWCTAIRLYRNEPKIEAVKKGAEEGRRIVDSFESNPYTADLARNPLMLSAICLVNYFEGGHLPADRAVLYKLCVEGLLHNWDQRRGIRSDYPLTEKLRVCREVAIAMQATDLAESSVGQIQNIFAHVLSDDSRAKRLLEHIRHRTGVLIERRPNVFSFAHLTFQEYLAACALVEGNLAGLTPNNVASEQSDGRWNEVIPLYCGIAPAPQGRVMLELLMENKGGDRPGELLTEAYMTSNLTLRQDKLLCAAIVDRLARDKYSGSLTLDRFSDEIVASMANRYLGLNNDEPPGFSAAYAWLLGHNAFFDEGVQLEKLARQQWTNAYGLAELMFSMHQYGSERSFKILEQRAELYADAAPTPYVLQGIIALSGISERSSLERFTLPCFRLALTAAVEKPDSIPDIFPDSMGAAVLGGALLRLARLLLRDRRSDLVEISREWLANGYAALSQLLFKKAGDQTLLFLPLRKESENWELLETLVAHLRSLSEGRPDSGWVDALSTEAREFFEFAARS